MFCLRSWIPILFFLTNASPIFIVLFVPAIYSLNRPCHYCSILLIILIVTLFDFSGNWFEPQRAAWPLDISAASLTFPGLPNTESATSAFNAAVEVLASTFNSTTTAIMDTIHEGLRRSATGQISHNGTSDWFRDALGRKEWRVPCIDAVIRI